MNAADDAVKKRRGRPSKGDRRLLTVRVPAAIGDQVIADAESRAYSDVLADIVIAHYTPTVRQSPGGRLPLVVRVPVMVAGVVVSGAERRLRQLGGRSRDHR